MKIRTKITLYLGLFVFIFVAAIFIINYSIIRHSLTLNAQQELIKIETNMHRAAEALLSSAIKNYLRGITEKNLDFIQHQYDGFVNGSLSKSDAKNNIQNHFNLQKVGVSGYLVAVEKKDKKLYLDLHPYLPKQECTSTEGCQQWDLTTNGYTEYNWKNPTDNTFRKKAAYVQEFTPWDWIVGASSYRDEFVSLVKITDLRELIEPVRINKTGYFFVFDENYKILIHPELTDSFASELVNSKGQNILQLLIHSQDHFITYLWKNPSDDVERMKYAVIDKLEGYNWYLVGTGYLDEVYEPIGFLKNLTILVIFIAGSLLLFLIFRLSGELTSPLHILKKGIDQFYRDKKTFRWEEHSITELNVLGNAFAQMSSDLNQTMEDLQQKNIELETSEQQKEENRILLESIINSMPSIIIGVNHEFRLTLWNQQAEKVARIIRNDANNRLLTEVFPQLEPHLEAIRADIEAKKTNTHPFSHIDEEGHKHFSEMTIYPLRAFSEN